MQFVTRRERLHWLGLALAVLIMVVGAVIAYLGTRSPDQARVSAGVLPVTAAAHRTVVYVDCSKIGAVTYDPQNPCQTFVLLQSDHFRSAGAFLDAEARQLRDAGWRHPSRPPPVDYDSGEGAMATLTESWVAPRRQGCAYVATAQTGIAAEAKGLFPYDPYNQPQGVLDFYRKAKAAKAGETLWARLRATNATGRMDC